MVEDGLGSFVTLIYELTIKGVRHSLPVQTREQLSGIGCPLPPGSQGLNSGSVLAANAFTHRAILAPPPTGFLWASPVL